MGSSVSIPQVSAETMVGVTGCSAPMLQPRNVGTGDSPGSRCEVAMWSVPPSDTVLHLLSYVPLTAQAMTAALTAGRPSMDWAGGCMLGCITALGGGTIRDVLLGHYPLVWVQNPSYLALTAVAAFATILIARHVHRLNVAFLVLDAIGLVVYTMAGCDVAWQDGRLPADRDRRGHDHRLRRRRAARHPLQRCAAAVSQRTLCQRVGRDRT